MGDEQESAGLGEALEVIMSYAQDSAEEGSSFKEQVVAVCDSLRTILRDSVAIQKYASDPETRADLLYRISSSYTTTPDLRVTWRTSSPPSSPLHPTLAPYIIM